MILVPQIAFFIPVLLTPFIWFLRRHYQVRNFVSLIFSVALFSCNLLIFYNFSELENISFILSAFTEQIAVEFVINYYGVIFAMLASFLWVIVNIYSFEYFEKELSLKIQYSWKGSETSLSRLKRLLRIKDQTKFYIFMSLAISATMAVAYSANLVTMFIFYEILTIATYPLVAHYGSEHSKKAAKSYLKILLASSMVFFLPAIVLIALIFPSTEFINHGVLNGLTEEKANLFAMILLICFTFGISKNALFPFHKWLPTAMVAPAPVSGLLHAVAVVKSGIFCMVKVVIFTIGVERLSNLFAEYANFMLILAGFSICYSSIIAIYQTSIKKMLAYSTISQLSLCLFALFMFKEASGATAIMHMLTHAFAKITLFLAAGSIYLHYKMVEIQDVKGLFYQNPLIATCVVIAIFSIIGLPVASGYLSKFEIVKIAFQSVNFEALNAEKMFLAFILLVNPVLSAAYFMPLVINVFSRQSKNISRPINDLMSLAILLSTLSLMILGLFLEKI